jgi:hypothetical protein
MKRREICQTAKCLDYVPVDEHRAEKFLASVHDAVPDGVGAG